MRKAFQSWRKRLWPEYNTHSGGKEERKRRAEREKTYGIKHWGRVRSIPKIHTQVKNFLQKGIG
eukprot:675971-Pleurochrysis_carterae.AAC.1